MKRSLTIGFVAILAVFLLGLLAPFWGQALASQRAEAPGAESRNPAGVTTRYYSIPGATFVLGGQAWNLGGSMTDEDGTFASAIAVDPTLLFAPVHLPDGSTITKLEAWVGDQSDTYDVRVDLERLSDLTSTVSSLANASSTVTSTSWVKLESVLSHNVDNATGSYMVRVRWPATVFIDSDISKPASSVRNVRITYTVPGGSPTAVTLTDFDAISGATGWLQGAAVLVIGMAVAGAAKRKRRKG